MRGSMLGAAVTMLWLSAAPPLPAASLSGALLDSATGQPLVKAEVRLLGGPAGDQASTRPVVATGEHGEFLFENVPPGRYRLLARMKGYQNTPLGATADDSYGRTLTVAAAGLSGVEYLLPPLSAIQGRVVDADGEPVAGALIVLGPADAYGAPPMLTPTGVVTDQNGEYRASVPLEGRYYVQAVPPPHARKDGRVVDLPAFFPSVGRFAEAVPVRVNNGGRSVNTAITLREAPAFRVSGHFTGLEAGYSGISLSVVPDADVPALRHAQDYVFAFSKRARVKVTPDGAFEVGELAAGSYELQAVRLDGPDGSSVLARRMITVADRDVDGLTMNLAAAVRLTLRLEAETKKLLCQVIILPAIDVGMGGAVALATLAQPVTVDAIAPAAYALSATCTARDWVVRSAQLGAGPGAKDVTQDGLRLEGASGEQQLTIRLTKSTGSVTVRVKDGDELGAGRYVTLIPSPPTLGSKVLMASQEADESGQATLNYVKPGEYCAYAWLNSSLARSPLYPEYLKPYEPQCVRVTVKAGMAAQVQIATVKP